MSTLPVTQVWKLMIGWTVIKRIAKLWSIALDLVAALLLETQPIFYTSIDRNFPDNNPLKDGAQLPLLDQYWHISYFLISSETRVSQHRGFVGLCWKQSENSVYMTWCPPKTWFPVILKWLSSCLWGTRAPRGLSLQLLWQSGTPVAQ